MKILYVDDDAVNVRVLKRLMQARDGLDLITRGTLTAGKRALVKEQPDVVLVDYNLPDGQGVALGREARQRLPGVPVYLVTALAGRDLAGVMREARDAFDGALRKPLDVEAVAGILESA